MVMADQWCGAGAYEMSLVVGGESHVLDVRAWRGHVLNNWVWNRSVLSVCN